MKNNIIYYNNDEDAQLAGLVPDSAASYCCIQDCNEVNNNINDEPGFAYTTEPNNLPVVVNYHLVYNSVCVNTGDSAAYTSETAVFSQFSKHLFPDTIILALDT